MLMYHMTLLCIAGHFWWYGINNDTYFLFFRRTLQAWLVTKIGGGQPSAVPVQCCLRIFSGWKCLRFPLSPVYSQLSFILMASVPTMEMTCPSMFSRTVTLARCAWCSRPMTVELSASTCLHASPSQFSTG